LLSYCPLYFERDAAGDFRAPDQWRAQALAVVGTHDLPTLAGWWQGEDIELAARLSREPDAAASTAAHGRQVIERAQARAQLLLALEREGLLPEGTSVHPTSMPGAGPRLVEAVHAFLARTPCLLLGVQIEDVTGQLHAVNVPGTLESQHPNWRRKLGIAIDDLAVDARMLGVARVLAGRAAAAAPGEAAPLPAAGEVPDIAGAEVPASTYRVQLHAGFGFDAAARAVPYLAALGVSHLYVSPWQRARAGSTHGYDVVDHDALNPELGDEAAFERLCQALAAHGMRQMLDIVPNHMGVLEADNAWWLDVLEHGPASLQAETFDIDWSPSDPQMQGRVLLPVLGDHYGRVLEAGELKLVFEAEEGSFHIAYWNHRFPIDPRDYPALLGRLPLPAGLPEEEHARIESVLHALAQLPPRSDTSADARATRARDARVHKRTLARRVAAQPLLAVWIDAAVQSYGGTPGEAASFDALDALIARQAWRLAYWRVAGDEINYRRFFDINTLAALRTEREPVFEATHRRVLRWLQDGCVHALRIDHPDGLADPRGYFARLQARQAQACERAGLPRRALYLVVEKILADHEDLPADWPVHGGTGYRFSNLVNGLFVDATGEGQLTRVYADFIGERLDFGDVLYDAKRLIMDVALASDLQWLAEALLRISRADRRTCDFTRAGLRLALAEVAAGFPVYRTYLTGDGQASETDRRYLDQAIARARRRGVAGDVSVLQHLRHVLLAPPGEDAAHEPGYEAARRAFIARWQQFTAPVMAKAMEDTAFYRYHRLVSLNDVGGDPRTFGTPPKAFHAVCESQAAERPNWLLGSSTHDSKRSEDVRTRLDVLAEMPAEWAAAVHEWRTLADAFAGSVAGLRAPTRNDEYLLYQTLVGVWPLVPTDEAARQDLRERVGAYMLKAMREAKQETSWINPDDAYEAAMAGFIDGLFASREFVASLEAFVARIAPAGLANSLNLVMLKFMAPGVPDVYQGCEGWNFSLVDPDNRRPVDFEGAAARLAVVRGLYGQRDASALATPAVPARGDWEVLRARPDDGRLKQLVTWRLLQLRAAQPGFFARAGYAPIAARGSRAEHVLAFARTAPDDTQDGSAYSRCVVAVASRLPWRRLGGDAAAEALSGSRGWDDTTLQLPAAPGGWRELFTGRAIAAADAAHAVGELLHELPLAVLVPTAWWPHDPSPASKVIP
nr:malto-oligosyltrehalose synthase [Burkholderiaceae bacterium]